MAKSGRFAYARSMSDRQDWVQEGIAALRAGDRREARRLLGRAVNENPNNVAAWWFLAAALEDPEQKIYALRQVLRLRPDHEEARQFLSRLERRVARVTPPGEAQPPALEARENTQGDLAVVPPAPARVQEPGQAAQPAPRRRPGCAVAAGALLLVLAGAGVLAVLWAGSIDGLLGLTGGPQPEPVERFLLFGVPACETTGEGETVLVFENDAGVAVEVLRGTAGSEELLMRLEPGEQGETTARPGVPVRYAVRTAVSGLRGTGAVYEVPPSSVCRVTIR